jgi:uncharacterized protein (DUF305 family)
VNINASQPSDEKLSEENKQKDNATNPEIQNQYLVMFAQMMIPHHQQAVDMGTLAETRASNAAVKSLASQIKSEQAPEIELMKGWLNADGDSGVDADPNGMGMDNSHSMNMDGMLTDAQMAELKAASGANFDKLYLTYMIAHHEGAIKMANMALKAKTTKLTELAKAIVKSQTAQIKTMKALLAK